MKKLPSKTLLLAASLGFGVTSHAAVYSQNFAGLANGTTTFADGSVLTQSATPPGGSVQNEALELTHTTSFGVQNSWNIPALANSALGFTVSFQVTLTDTAGGNPPADGFSFNYGAFASSANYGEEGVGTGLSWIVDTWDNGTLDRGIRSKINGVNDFVLNNIPLVDGQTLTSQVLLSWNPTNGMSLSIDGAPIFANRPTPGFTGDNANLFGFGARTGNASETVALDNIVITTVPESSSVLLAAMAGLGLLSVRRRK
jgi:hypothetical protein